MAQVRFDDINVGDEIPIQIERTITQGMISRWAEVSVDFNPLHVDPEFGKTTPFGSAIAHGHLSITYILEMLTRWLGEEWLGGGQLKQMRFVSPVKPGDSVMPGGKVVDKRLEGERKVIECDVWLENQDGTQTIVGKAIATLE
jgi:acyl dehydratase